MHLSVKKEMREENPNKRGIYSPCPVYGGVCFFYEGKNPTYCIYNTDTADTGQVPNALQLDPA